MALPRELALKNYLRLHVRGDSACLNQAGVDQERGHHIDCHNDSLVHAYEIDLGLFTVPQMSCKTTDDSDDYS